MFERVEPIAVDSILTLMAAYRADPDPGKVDLGIGIYRDDHGETPVLAAVQRAESALLASQTTKAYVGPTGNPGFNQAMERLVFGAGHPLLGTARRRTAQAVGGGGALRLGAEIIRAASPGSVVHVPTPTWANHTPLLSGAGLELASYPYFDAATGGVQFNAMIAALGRLPAGAVVLLHASCHNPTGADLSEVQWREILALGKRRGLLPFFHMAYQGAREGPDAAVVYGILEDAALRAAWVAEVAAMRSRISALRSAVVQQLRQHCPQRDFGFIAGQRGMFSYFGISTAQVRELRSRHHIYMTDDSRMNVAGLRRENLEYFACSVAEVLGH